MPKTLLELTNICKSFVIEDVETRALKDINLLVNEGEYVSLMGPSGSGKSTLLSILGLLNEATLLRLQNATTEMENIVTSLLSLAHEDSGLEQKCPVHILPIVEDVMIQYSNLLESKHVTVDIDIKQDAKVFSHPTSLRILLANMISNAFKYTQEGSVSINYSNSTLIVSDSGVGIGDSIKDTVFESGVKSKHSNGFGIGLSLVRRLCEK